MAPKMKQVKLDPAAHARLVELGKDLQTRGFPRNLELQDMLAALALFTPAPQLAGMLQEYWRHTATSQPPSVIAD